MEFRSALPVAVLLGGVIGAAAVGNGSPKGRHSYDAVSSLVSEAEASTSDAKWDIPVVRNAPVQRFIDLFSGKQQDRMALYLKRSGRYEGMIRTKLRARGMPEDLLYLSMIESGFNPTARSSAQAVGLWQFMGETGRNYGLRVDQYVDERRDPEKSTDAALRYLSDLHAQFDSWYLAAAAYNSGENRISRVMKEETGSEKGDETSFWRIRHRLPAETREYVPLMLAAALVGKEPEKYGLADVSRWLPVETETVKVPGGTGLAVVAEAVGVQGRDVAKLNPSLVKAMTPPGKPFDVRIPVGRSGEFAANFERVHKIAVENARIEEARRAAAARQARIERQARERAAARAAAAKRARASRAHRTTRHAAAHKTSTRRHVAAKHTTTRRRR
ncbi:MAG TPA: transglycosylase SLT domain-containing protein [Longimicrobiaceae bacterium]|jgi:membrane-bound lytic murein transglycosylase D|nr:transglycosylase SLT domain-containing protein [Longimicrobiaceae bacterium]